MRLMQPGACDGDLMLAACHAGRLRDVEALVRTAAPLEVRSYNGQTPLMLAVMGQNVPLVALLLQAGADVNACDEAGTTPLHLAAAIGDLSCLRLLCQAPGIEMHRTLHTHDSYTALDVARFAQMHATAAFLAECAELG